MDVLERLRILGGTAADDLDGPGSRPAARAGRAPAAAGIARVSLPGGRTVPVLRLLMTNVCELNCGYCAINRERNVRRASLRPEEVARLTAEFARRGLIAGLFLSSGVAGGPARTTERMLQAVEILRERERFRGYVHLKLMPGVSEDYVERALDLADRVSINLEAATEDALRAIAPMKDYRKLVGPMAAAHRLAARREGALPAGQVTQVVVGAAGESDREILTTAGALYRQFRLRRVYYSAYHPVCGQVLAPPTPPIREHRLYQADWLVRHYGFRPADLVLDDRGNLPLRVDPKLAWALAHPERFPVEVNTADLRALLLVPGIGPISARRILSLRPEVRVRDLRDLARLGVVVKRARHFLTLDGRYPGGPDVPHAEARQLALWPEGAGAPCPLLGLAGDVRV